jgi:hypothetical protein
MKPSAEIVKQVRALAYNKDPRTVFSDFCELFAIALSQPFNQLNRPLWERREAQYLRVVSKYDKRELDGLIGIREAVIDALERTPVDVLGNAYEELEVANKAAGQFFTPYHLCELMAEIMVDDALIAKVESDGFITVGEPASGSGAMVIAMANIMKAKGLNPQRHMHVTTIDKMATAAHMCYIQLSLLGIPAAVWIGNTLSMEMQEKFLTPMHIIGGWAPSRGDVTLARHVAKAAPGTSDVRLTLESATVPPPIDIVTPSQEQLDLFGMEGAA